MTAINIIIARQMSEIIIFLKSAALVTLLGYDMGILNVCKVLV